MNIRYYITGIVFIIATVGCAKSFNLEMEETPPLYVIEGRVSNMRGPYYIRITKSTNLLNIGNNVAYGLDSAEPVKGALVVIADDLGVTDTLKPSTGTGSPRYVYYYSNGVIDSSMAPFHAPFYTNDRGYYETTKLTGQPGHNYHLTVRIGSSTFHASAYMAPVPTLDSAVIKETVVDTYGNKGYLPFVWFKEPENENNYYLFQHNNLPHYLYDDVNETNYSAMFFPFYVLDDKTMPTYVAGLGMRVIVSSQYRYGDNYPYRKPAEPKQVKLSSLTKEAYEYFNVQGKQFENDGNIYKPVPATPKGNISGNALGLFWATQVSYKLVMP